MKRCADEKLQAQGRKDVASVWNDGTIFKISVIGTIFVDIIENDVILHIVCWEPERCFILSVYKVCETMSFYFSTGDMHEWSEKDLIFVWNMIPCCESRLVLVTQQIVDCDRSIDLSLLSFYVTVECDIMYGCLQRYDMRDCLMASMTVERDWRLLKGKKAIFVQELPILRARRA